MSAMLLAPEPQSAKTRMYAGADHAGHLNWSAVSRAFPETPQITRQQYTSNIRYTHNLLHYNDHPLHPTHPHPHPHCVHMPG